MTPHSFSLHDLVEFESSSSAEDKEHPGDVIIIGEVVRINPNKGRADVLEAHAFHHIWGGSNAQRGRLHEGLRLEDLRIPNANMTRIAREGVETYRKNPEKWDRKRMEIEQHVRARRISDQV